VHGRARFAPTARARIDVKSATYHRLAVERTGGVWTLSAVLDV
jgi:SHS2 domain-containing protein